MNLTFPGATDSDLMGDQGGLDTLVIGYGKTF